MITATCHAGEPGERRSTVVLDPVYAVSVCGIDGELLRRKADGLDEDRARTGRPGLLAQDELGCELPAFDARGTAAQVIALMSKELRGVHGFTGSVVSRSMRARGTFTVVPQIAPSVVPLLEPSR